jgi:outer membrane protein TolC
VKRMREWVAAQIEEVGLKMQASEAAFRAGRGAQADVFALRSEEARLKLQFNSMDGEINAAQARLVRWIGSLPSSGLGAPPDITRLDWAPPLGEDASALEVHPTLAAAARRVELAQAEVRLARSQLKPDVTVELMYSQRGAADDKMVSLSVSMPLQWQRDQRQDRELAARFAGAEQMRAEQEDERRSYRAEVAARYALWQSALKNAAQYEQELSPLAEQQAQAALADYRSGGGMLIQVLEARRMVLDTRMQALRAQREAAMAWAQLNFLNLGQTTPVAPTTAAQGQ